MRLAMAGTSLQRPSLLSPSGGAWSWGLPDERHALAEELLGKRLILWPGGFPPPASVAVISSRQKGGWNGRWLEAFRMACRAALQWQRPLVTADKCFTDRLVSRAAQRTGLPLIRVHMPPAKVSSLGHWIARAQRRPLADDGTSVYLSPLLDGALSSQPALSPRDAMISVLAETIYVCAVRRGGNIERLIRRILATNAARHKQWFVNDDPQMIDVSLLRSLFEYGAVPWRVCPETVSTKGETLQKCAADGRPAPPPSPLSGDFLTHCTRSPLGPWPDETEQEYLDERLDGGGEEPRTALGALRRILRQESIRGTAATIRGGTKVVCLTEERLHRLADLRVFRIHRHRWDFEPFGICLSRSWLRQRGARPVIYGDDATWQQLQAHQRPFFQRQQSRVSDAGGPIDWQREREWRYLGDLCLRQLPTERAFCFVPTHADARELAAYCRWPIIILEEALSSG